MVSVCTLSPASASFYLLTLQHGSVMLRRPALSLPGYLHWPEQSPDFWSPPNSPQAQNRLHATVSEHSNPVSSLGIVDLGVVLLSLFGFRTHTQWCSRATSRMMLGGARGRL